MMLLSLLLAKDSRLDPESDVLEPKFFLQTKLLYFLLVIITLLALGTFYSLCIYIFTPPARCIQKTVRAWSLKNLYF
jgi:hypothetical protein